MVVSTDHLGNGGMMGDVVKYFVYVDRIVKGLTPYSDYPVEYPILALPIFLVPRLIVTDFHRFVLTFILELALFNAVAVYLVALQI